MKVDPVKTRIFQAGEDLADFILEHIPKFENGDILVITSKIAALAENRVVPFESKEQKEALIQQESDWAIQTPYTWLTLKSGLVTANAGIDESNADGEYMILLPQDCQAVARKIRDVIKNKFGLKAFGVVVSDSRLMPLRKGTLGAAYGYAGFTGLRSYVGEQDLFGRPFKLAKLNIPDSIATAAVLVMGEGDESQPLAVVKNFDAEFIDEPVDPDELKIALEDDIYGPLFRGINDHGSKDQ